jgi:acyl dehydratase
MIVNYALDRVRFPRPAMRERRSAVTVALEDFRTIPDGAQAAMLVTIEAEASEKPRCVALLVSRLII